jgi:hypothetical protein
VKDENGDLFADPHNISKDWRATSISRYIHKVSNVRKIEIHTVKLLVPGTSPFEDEIAIAKLKKYNSPGIDQILVECFKHKMKYYSKNKNIRDLYGGIN